MNGPLLDTHIFLWYDSNDAKLPSAVRAQIENEPGAVYLSSVSAWEITIKHGLGKLDLPQPITDLFDLAGRGIELLTPAIDDLVAYSQLGFPLKEHRDPFDRILVVQAREKTLTLVTADRAFGSYLPSNLLHIEPA